MLDKDGIRCEYCGSILCSTTEDVEKEDADEENGSCVEDALAPVKSIEKEATKPSCNPSRAPPKIRKIKPGHLHFHAVRTEMRCRMLQVLPKISAAKALAIVSHFPNFKQLIARTPEELATVVVHNRPLGIELGKMIHRVLH